MFVKRSARLGRSEGGWVSVARGFAVLGTVRCVKKGSVGRTCRPSGKARGLDRGLEHQKRGLGVSLRTEESLKRFLLWVDNWRPERSWDSSWSRT